MVNSSPYLYTLIYSENTLYLLRKDIISIGRCIYQGPAGVLPGAVAEHLS